MCSLRLWTRCGWAQGVCQDFAHLLLGAARKRGLPARYVSGYLVPERSDNPNSALEEVIGGQASHAWAEVYIPECGWMALDPTLGQAGGSAACAHRLWARLWRRGSGAGAVQRTRGTTALGGCATASGRGRGWTRTTERERGGSYGRRNCGRASEPASSNSSSEGEGFKVSKFQG